MITIDGERYQDCWLDSTPDRTGKKHYTRLRWFIDVATKKKGCRTLRGDEVGRATRAIALCQLEADLARVGEELRKVEELAARLGLEVPAVSVAQVEADPQTIPDGTQVKVPSGWEAQIIGYAGGDRYHLRFLTGIKGQTDIYPARMLTVE
ncbi:hypothetical protein NDI52_27560 [Leptolyngbya sp. PL-A3]|uniref:hypothetical protein n=1 Tax=Leptolyngbya sp. PL-A3 TaxID=2933911 RepID=UPI0032968CE9